MSLINDAIKQANKANKEREAAKREPGAATAGMQTTAPHAGEPSGAITGMLLIGGIVIFVLLGGSLLFLAMRDRPSKFDSAQPSALRQAPAPTPAVETPPIPAPEQPDLSIVTKALENPLPPVNTGAPPPAIVAPPAPPTTAATGTTTSTTPTPVPAPAPAGPRPFPELKLQGIYYRLTDPSVMISGKTLEIGDIIQDVRVIRIERKEVTLELDGQQKVLRLQ